MANKKTQTKKAPVVAEKAEIKISEPQKNVRLGKYLLVAAVLILLGFLIFRNRSLFVVAIVDNKPIWRPVFEERMISQVGQKTLDDIINEEILLGEASKRGIVVSQSEVDTKVSEIEKTLPEGTTLSQALSMQGMTLDDLRRQMTLQLTIEKMLDSSIKVTDQEVTEYLEKNKEFLTATDEAALNAEAKAAIMNEKRNSEFQKLFTSLQKNAKVTKFL